jgi:hypothetical protein
MTTVQTTPRLPRPLYAVAGVGDLAYRRISAGVRTLREDLPNRVDALWAQVPALRAQVPARVTTIVAEARDVYTGLVAHGEQVVDTARTHRANGHATVTPDAAVSAKPAAKAARKATKKTASRAAKA